MNLADALVRYHNKKVVVVDLALASGDVTTFFNVNPAYSILDLAKNAEKADYDFLTRSSRSIPAGCTSWPTRRRSRMRTDLGGAGQGDALHAAVDVRRHHHRHLAPVRGAHADGPRGRPTSSCW